MFLGKGSLYVHLFLTPLEVLKGRLFRVVREAQLRRGRLEEREGFANTRSPWRPRRDPSPSVRWRPTPSAQEADTEGELKAPDGRTISSSHCDLCDWREPS